MALIQKRPYALDIYNPETDLTPKNEIVLLVDHSSWPEPKRVEYNPDILFPDLSTATKSELLNILEVADVVSDSELTSALSGKINAETGKSLVDDTLIESLASIYPNVYKINLSASSDVTGRLSGATYPSGWSLSSSGNNLIVTHNLTGRSIANVTVKELGTPNRIVTPFEDAYAGISESGQVVTIEGLDTEAVALQVNLIFN